MDYVSKFIAVGTILDSVQRKCEITRGRWNDTDVVYRPVERPHIRRWGLLSWNCNLYVILEERAGG
jgi:hypothetical protein